MKNFKSPNSFPQQINMFLDNELDKSDENQFLSTLQDNRSYNSMLDNERSFRSFVKTNVQKSNVPATLIKSIKDKIKISYR